MHNDDVLSDTAVVLKCLAHVSHKFYSTFIKRCAFTLTNNLYVHLNNRVSPVRNEEQRLLCRTV